MNPNDFYETGLSLFEKGQIDEALEVFKTGLERHPTDARLLNGRGAILGAQGRIDEAIADLDEAIRLDPNLAKAYANRGSMFQAQGETKKALLEFNEAIRLDPTLAKAIAARGRCFFDLGRYEEAVEDFAQYIGPDCNEAWAYGWRGFAHYKLGETDNALDDYDRSLALDATDAWVFNCRGAAYHSLGDYESALKDYDEAIRLRPEYANAYLNRASIWKELGEFENAEQDLDRFEKLKADQSEGISMSNRQKPVLPLLEQHFAPANLDEITITERRFPTRVRADLQRAIDRLISEQVKLLHFSGIRKKFNHEGVNFSELLILDRNDPVLSVPPQCEEIDIGEESTIKCLKDGLWLMEQNEQKFAFFLEPPSHFGRMKGLRLQIATVNDQAGQELSERILKQLEQAILESACYRGKILSFQMNSDYSGVSTGITVHKLKPIDREQVILPRKTLELLERNVIQFVSKRSRLNELGISTKKGLLFYGPPGTGKTHTIHYLAGALKGHTTLLVSAEQVGLLGEYMTLARLLQPSIVVLEDVDLIARDRTEMHSPCEEVLLNKLLNEMDGLQADADILFILTTNRPETLEMALASRPGRIDQAIEFPLPDEEGRDKLIRLYAFGVDVPDDVVKEMVRKTECVSAAFIKELMRRAMQFHLERCDSPTIEMQDVDSAIEELLFSGGSLNRKLLGAKLED